MDKELSCNQVGALINFYIQGKLNEKLSQYVRHHILNCKKCQRKIDSMKIKSQNIKEQKCKIIPLNTDLKRTLSAYIDNELNNSDTIKIKKRAISNLSTRKELENMYKFKQLIQSAYERTKENSKFDFSKNIIYQLQNGEDYSTTYFKKLIIIFTGIICIIIAGIMYLYF